MERYATVGPWGEPGTPLAPAQLRQRCGEEPAPDRLRAKTAQGLRLRDLGTEFWENNEVTLDAQDLEDVVAAFAARMPQIQDLPILETTWQADIEISDLPLKKRTTNALQRAEIETTASLANRSIAEILQIRWFGVTSLVDLLCVLEAAVAQDWSSAVPVSHLGDDDELSGWRKSLSELGSCLPVIAAWAKGEQDLKVFGDLLSVRQLNPPPEIEEALQVLDEVVLDKLAGHNADRFSVPKAVDRLLDGMDRRDELILTARVVAIGSPATLEVLGREAGGVTRERVRQIDKRIREQLAADAVEGPLLRRALEVRQRIGAAAPLSSERLRGTREWALRDFDGEADLPWLIILHLGGPYREKDGWLVRPDTVDTDELLRRATDDGGFVGDPEARAVLSKADLHSDVHCSWIEQRGGFKRVEDGWLRWDGATLDKLERLLRRRRSPATAEQLLEEAGEDRSIRGIHQRMIEDPRFIRINRQGQFVLPGWGFDEYTGITAEITQEIEQCGGLATEEHLIATVSSRYGVAPSSVQVYLNAPMFVRSGTGGVRLRETDDALPRVKQELSEASDSFRREGRWSLRVRIDGEVLRGSGREIPPAFAAHVGILPGDKRNFSSPHGSIVISWSMSAAMGPALGSIRSVAEALGGSEGDLIFLEYDGEDRFSPRLVAESAFSLSSGPALAAQIMGLPSGQSTLPDLAEALGLEGGREDADLRRDVERALKARRDIELIRLLPPTEEAEDLDAVLRRLDQALS